MAAILFGTHSGKASMVSYGRDDVTQRLTSMQLNRQVNPGVTDELTNLTHDPAGNITQVKATLAGGQVDNQCFAYDHQQQLTEAWTPNTSSCDPGARSQAALGGPAPYWTSWATNTIGKTTSRTDRTPTKSSTTSYTYPGDGASSSRPHFVTGTTTTGDAPGNASYTADAAGNTTKRPAPGGGEQNLAWDELNQLTEVTKAGTPVAKMVYDAAGGRLLRQQGDTTTLYVAGSEITLNATTSTVSANRYYTHAGQTVAIRTGASNDTVSTLISDWQGTTHHQITNSSGALSTSWQDPYGNPRGTPPTAWTGERGFVGGTKDTTGLTRIGARDYDPALQRFVTVDPLHDLADPLQWNAYLYANSSPITRADPTGLVSSPYPPPSKRDPKIETPKHVDRARPSKPKKSSPRPGSRSTPPRPRAVYVPPRPRPQLPNFFLNAFDWPPPYVAPYVSPASAHLIPSGDCSQGTDCHTWATGLGIGGAVAGAAVACAASGVVICITALAESELAAASGGSVGVGGLVAGGTRVVVGNTANGSLRVIGGGFSQSERYAAETLVGQGRQVVLREADSAAGRTSDLLVDGVRYDVYTPKTGNVDRIVSAIASKGSQVRGGGVVLDLSNSPLSAADVGNILSRVRGVTSQVSDVIVIGGK